MADGEVKQYVDIIGDALAGMKAQLNAAKHMSADKETIDIMELQINEYSAMRVQAQMELGKRTATIKTGFGNRFTVNSPTLGKSTTKAEQLKNIGIDSKRASEFETMARNEETVNQYIEESLASGKAPSVTGALKEIKKQKSYIEVSDEEQNEKEEVDTEEEFVGFKHSKIPLQKQQEIIAYCKTHELEPHKSIAKRFNVDYSTINRLRGFIGQQDPAPRAMNRRIDKMIAEKSIFSEEEIKPSDYTEEDAFDEMRVMRDEFLNKFERFIENRRSIVGGNKEVILFIKSFTKDIVDRLVDNAKKKGI